MFAFIGMACVLWGITKLVNKIGDTLNRIGDEMAIDSALKERYRVAELSALKSLAGIRNKTKVASEITAEEEYNKKVKQEIDDITKI